MWGILVRFTMAVEYAAIAARQGGMCADCHFDLMEIVRPRAFYATGNGGYGLPPAGSTYSNASRAVFYRMPLLMQMLMTAGRGKEKAPCR